MNPESGMPMAGQPNAASPVIDQAQAMVAAGEQGIRNRLVTEAYGTKLPQRRVPEEYEK
jgi:hypothetical protein